MAIRKGLTGTTKGELKEFERDFEDLMRDIAPLVRLGTNQAVVEELMDQARRSAEDGDIKKARLCIDKAHSTAITSTQNFINNYILEVREILLTLRSDGADIKPARSHLTWAKNELNQKEYRKAVTHCFEALYSVKGLPRDFRDAMVELMKARYDLTLAESIGIKANSQTNTFGMALFNLKARQYDKTIAKSKSIRGEVKSLLTDHRAAYRKLSQAKLVIQRGNTMGADVSEAEAFLNKGIARIKAGDMRGARILISQAIDSGIEAGKELVFETSIKAV
jgi:hypothetical protein